MKIEKTLKAKIKKQLVSKRGRKSKLPGVIIALICGDISAGNSPDCNYPLVGGVNERLVLMNYNDVASYTDNGTTKVCEAITMVALKVGYEWVGQNQSNEPKYSLVAKTYNNLYKHEVKFLAFNVSPASKLQLEKMAKGRVVAIVENNYKNAAGDTAFEIFGREAGLYVTAMERNPNDPDNQGAIVVTLSSSEKSLESRMPITLYDTDYTTTKALVDALV